MEQKGRETSDGDILSVRSADRYRTVGELIEKSQATSAYYTLLVLSSVMIAGGVLLNAPAIIIGGMLVTPVLSPLLLFALGLAVGEFSAVSRGSILAVKSFVIVILSAIVLTWIVGDGQYAYSFADTLRTSFLYVVVSFSAGVVGTLAWVRRDISGILPGAAIAVSLVPPLSVVGVGLSSWQLDLVRGHAFIFIFNVIGLVVGALIVFTLLRFQETRATVHNQIARARWRDYLTFWR